MNNVITFSFDEYSELIGVSVNGCGENYEQEKDEWLEEYYKMDENERYDEIVELDEGWMVNYGWGNYEVNLEFNNNVRYVYLNMSSEGNVEDYEFSNIRKEGYKEDVDKGVYSIDDDSWERGVYVLMIDVKELENYNRRDVSRLVG